MAVGVRRMTFLCTLQFDAVVYPDNFIQEKQVYIFWLLPIKTVGLLVRSLLVAGDRSTVITAPFRRVARWFIQTLARDSVSAIVFWVFFAFKQLLGRTVTRTRERMDRQSM